MTILVSIIIVLLGCFVVSFIVFGGAQMFIPYFKILLVNFLGIDNQTWESVLSITNATPGVFGIKIAMASGYLISSDQWWGWLLMMGTYLIFIIVPIVMILLISKKYQKIKTNKFMISFFKIMRPVIAGILSSIVINLFISLVVPFVGFNDLGTNFGELDKYFYLKSSSFFSQWRYWCLLGWSIISIPIDIILIKKYNISILLLIIIQIIICMVLFQPWLN